jgi:stage IV sporulation protein FB
VFIACVLALDHTGLAAFALLCAVIHECGHIIMLRILKAPVEKISFRLFGIGIVLKKGMALSYGQEIAVALAGGTANFITCIPAYILFHNKLFPGQSGAIFAFSLLLGIFNLLPIGSLDGGRALEAALCRKMSCGLAGKIVNIVSAIFIVPLTAAGVYVIIQTGYNISLIVAVIYLAAALVIKNGFIASTHAKNTSGR